MDDIHVTPPPSSDSEDSPLPPPKRKRGRPVGSKSQKKAEDISDKDKEVKKRGRPAGVKNKPKVTISSLEATLGPLMNRRSTTQTNRNLSRMNRALEAARYGQSDEESVNEYNANILCFCKSTQWSCSVCRIPTCDMCSPDPEEGSKRHCSRCF